MRFWLIITFTSVLTFALAPSARRIVQAWNQETISFSPFTVTIQELTLVDGKPVSPGRHVVHAYRTDGSEVGVFPQALMGPAGTVSFSVRRIVDVAGQREIWINEGAQSLSTYPYSSAGITRLLHSRRNAIASGCSADSGSVGLRHLGFDLLRKPKADSTRPGFIWEDWVARDLNCVALVSSLQMGLGPGIRKSIRVAVAVKPGEPDPALFSIPDSYEERAPSEVTAELKRRFPWLAGSPDPRTEAMKDEGYFRRNGRR
jgi:hypothetical protein